jgi:transcriptional regulator with XRE-family HTH domain
MLGRRLGTSFAPDVGSAPGRATSGSPGARTWLKGRSARAQGPTWSRGALRPLGRGFGPRDACAQAGRSDNRQARASRQDMSVPDRERAADRGSRFARHDLVTVGSDLRTARISSGKTLRDVGRAVGMSYSNVGRIERAALPSVTVTQLARIGAVVGLDVRVRTYPGPTPLRDAGQIALFDRLRARLGPGLTLRTEVPLQLEGDLRAWDAVIAGFEPATEPLHAEGETRLYDAQAQLRRIALKARDAEVDMVLLVVADTPRNRAAVRAAGVMITEGFPIPPRSALASLAAGRHPGGSALVFV